MLRTFTYSFVIHPHNKSIIIVIFALFSNEETESLGD